MGNKLLINNFVAIGEKSEVQKIEKRIDYSANKQLNGIEYKKSAYLKNKKDADAYIPLYNQLQSVYNALSPKAKNIVDDKVHSYYPKGENSHQGYNLHQIMKWFQESIPDKRELLNGILDKAKEYNYNASYKAFEFEKKKKLKKIDEYSSKVIDSILDVESKVTEEEKKKKIKNTLKARIEKMYLDSEIYQQAKITTLEEICKFYMFDKNLILNGEGFIYYANPKSYTKFNDLGEEDGETDDFEFFNKILLYISSTEKKQEIDAEIEKEHKNYCGDYIEGLKIRNEKRAKIRKGTECIVNLEHLWDDTPSYFEAYQEFLRKFHDDETITIIEQEYAKILVSNEFYFLEDDNLFSVLDLIFELHNHEEETGESYEIVDTTEKLFALLGIENKN